MTNVEKFIQTKIYRRHDGSITPFVNFRNQFVAWLDCPALQLYWTQHQRVERALADLGFPVGHCQDAKAIGRVSVHIGNLAGPGSHDLRHGRAIIQENGWLVARDLTTDEQETIANTIPPCTKGGER